MGFAGAANAQFYIGAHGGVNFVPDSDMDDPLVPHPHKAGELSTVAGITDGMSASCERIPWLTVLTCPWRSLATSAAIQRVLPRTNRLMRSEEHTSELQSLMRISYAVFCLKKKK